jgi:hypothetical protein
VAGFGAVGAQAPADIFDTHQLAIIGKIKRSSLLE